ncbi:MAG: hypothetical protein KDD55_10305 [Bdellovibrionales bacterium]|nr:hypothetical protein [Bdellovibrionales bacterium]
MSEFPRNSDDLRQRGRSTTLVRHVKNAESVIGDLETSQSRELRGNPSRAIRALVEDFLEHDHVYRHLEDLYEHNEVPGEKGRERFRVAVAARIRTFETLISRNPDVHARERLGGDCKWAHRRLAAEVYEHLREHGSDIAGPSIFRLQSIRDATSVQPTVAKTSQSASPSKGLDVAEGDLELLDNVVDFLSSKHTRYTQFEQLWTRIHACLDEAEHTVVREMLLEALDENPFMTTELARINSVLIDCKEVSESPPSNIFELFESAQHIEELRIRPPFGFETHDPYLRLVEESYLSKEASELLQGAYLTLNAASEEAQALIRMMDQRGHTVEVQDVARLNAALDRLHRCGYSQEQLEGRVQSLFAAGPERLTHLETLVALAEEGVDILPYINVSPTDMHAIALVQGDMTKGMYRSGVTNEFVPKHIERAIRAGCKRAAEVPPEVYEKVQHVLKRHEGNSDPRVQGDLETALLLIATQVKSPDSQTAFLDGIRQDLLAISAAGGDLRYLHDFFRERHHAISPERFVHFVQDLSQLHSKNVKGIGHLLQDTHGLWNDEQRMKRGANMSGFLNEARVALDLIRHGFTLTEVAIRPNGDRFPYDAIGYTPEGKPCSIETKNSLKALSEKEKDDFEQSQLVRFTRSALQDGYEPYIVVPYLREEEAWAVTHLQRLYERMTEELHIPTLPKVLASRSGKEIPV